MSTHGNSSRHFTNPSCNIATSANATRGGTFYTITSPTVFVAVPNMKDERFMPGVHIYRENSLIKYGTRRSAFHKYSQQCEDAVWNARDLHLNSTEEVDDNLLATVRSELDKIPSEKNPEGFQPIVVDQQTFLSGWSKLKSEIKEQEEFSKEPFVGLVALSVEPGSTASRLVSRVQAKVRGPSSGYQSLTAQIVDRGNSCRTYVHTTGSRAKERVEHLASRWQDKWHGASPPTQTDIEFLERKHSGCSTVQLPEEFMDSLPMFFKISEYVDPVANWPYYKVTADSEFPDTEKYIGFDGTYQS